MLKSSSFELYSRILCPPGEGVYTHHTAREKKDGLHRLLYGATEGVEEKWKHSLSQFADTQGPYLLGLPSDAGGGILRGANWGPLGVRLSLTKGDRGCPATMGDLGDIRVIPHLLHDKYLNEETILSCRRALYGPHPPPLPVSPLSLAEHFGHDFFGHYPDARLLGLGGDHSVSYPLVKSFLKAKKQQGRRVALIHFDAHTDLLTERLGIDLCFGSWLAHILPHMESPDLVHQFGIRSSGQKKAHWEATWGVRQWWAQDIRREGMPAIVEQALDELLSKGAQEFYLSFDIDAMDSDLVGKTGTPERDGLFPEEVYGGIEKLGNSLPLSACDLVEVAPYTWGIGRENSGDQTLEISAHLAHLMLSLMAKGRCGQIGDHPEKINNPPGQGKERCTANIEGFAEDHRSISRASR